MNSRKLRLMILTHGSHQAAAIVERILGLPCAEVAGIFVETDTTRHDRLSEKLRRSIRYDGYVGTLTKYAKKLINLSRQRKKIDAGPSPSSQERLRDIAADHGISVHLCLRRIAAENDPFRCIQSSSGFEEAKSKFRVARFSTPGKPAISEQRLEG